MADHKYNPFLGFVKSDSGYGGHRHKKVDNGAMGGKMQAVNWESTKLVPASWKMVDAAALRKAAGGDSNGKLSGKPVKPLSEAEVAAWREANGISVFGDDCPPPAPKLEDLPILPKYIVKKFEAQGFTAPTPVQAQAWPVLLSGRDVVSVAKTGSGKTLAFMVPALVHIEAQPPLQRGDGPIAVVLAPTRELAQQIEQETKKVLPPSIYCGCTYGGAPKGPQLAMLRNGVHILVSTPGRLIDFLEIKRVSLLRTTYLVMDEADRMLDMGFEPQVRAICGQIRPDRQTLMFSATWPKVVQELAATFQRNWIRFHVGSTELLANMDVTQRFVLTNESSKLTELKNLMTTWRGKRVLVFCKTKKTADYLEQQLKRMGHDAMAIHGDKEQRQREFVLERFRRDTRLCVVATDVAARGLDIKQLEYVVNYDFPMQIDDYVHRIGRTGRAGAKGESVTFITKAEAQLTPPVVNTLIGILQRAKQDVPQWMSEWAAKTFYQVPKRNRNFTGGFDLRRSNGAPAIAHYSHSSRPSFDPSGNGSSGSGKTGGYFGLSGSGGAGKGIQYQKFASDDDDEDFNDAPKKKSKR